MKTRALLMALTLIVSAASLTSCGSADNAATESSISAGGEFARSEGEAVNADESPALEAAPDAAEEAAPAEAEAGEAELSADMLAVKDAEIGADDAVDVPDIAEEPEPDPDEDIIIDNGGEAFVLTAGEWNDNENWGFFSNIVSNGTISFPQYGLDPTHRVAVNLTNGGEPLRNKKVELKDGGTTMWSAVTDKEGNAYLFTPATAKVEYTVVAEGAEPVTVTMGSDNEEGQGTGIDSPELSIETGDSTVSYDKTQVMFILDTTGSMGDEIAYLQKDFTSIAEEVGGNDVTFSVNFYKDKGDDYVTSCNDFTDDIKSVQKLLNKERASGGGDTPEAVAEILDETMNSSGWESDSNKIAFLIFDAPPHNDTEQVIMGAIAKAAEQGIRLVPVVASNADRETELFGRAAAIMTGANYVFLTDDSGVGGSHLEPIIGAYDVELLHDIIVRNITELK
ncbi:MAG: VWA domain-containing protein [Ruminococcus sp.]|nr:VWA domain-containing protein [Ruminococcus sp.]